MDFRSSAVDGELEAPLVVAVAIAMLLAVVAGLPLTSRGTEGREQWWDGRNFGVLVDTATARQVVRNKVYVWVRASERQVAFVVLHVGWRCRDITLPFDCSVPSRLGPLI